MQKLNASTLGVAFWAVISAISFVVLKPLAQSLLLSADLPAQSVFRSLDVDSLVVAQVALVVLVMALALRMRTATTGLIAALVLSVVVYFVQEGRAGFGFALFPLVVGVAISVAAPVDSKQAYLGAVILAFLGCALHVEVAARIELDGIDEQITATLILAFTIYGPAALVGMLVSRAHAFASADSSKNVLPSQTASEPADTAASVNDA